MSLFQEEKMCIIENFWPNSVLIKKCVSFTSVSIILSLPYKYEVSMLSALYTVHSITWLEGTDGE